MITSYTDALTECSNSSCQVRDYVELRTELLTHASMYGRVIFPDSQTLVKNVRNAMKSLTLVENMDQFTTHMKIASDDCQKYEVQAGELEYQHSFVGGKLLALSTRLGEKMIHLDERGKLLQADANGEARKGQVLKRMSIASYLTIALIPVGLAKSRESRLSTERARLGSKEAADLIDAVLNIQALQNCCLQMRDIVHVLANILVFIGTQISYVASLIEHAKTIQIEDAKAEKEAAVEMYIRWIREAAVSIVLKLDPFISGRVEYNTAIAAVGMRHNLSDAITSEWRVDLDEYIRQKT